MRRGLRCVSTAAMEAMRVNAHVAPVSMLVDTHGRHHTYLRMSLTEKCNLRCQYCMPAQGVELSPESRILSTPEIVRIAELFVSRGVTKIRLTGGEPTVRKDFLEICRQLGGLPGLRTLGITTNGIKLERQLPELMAAGVNALNISLDTLVPAKFQFITRRTGFERVHGAITAALAAGFPSVKLNCVVMRGVNDDEIVDFVALTRDWPVHVRMIEYMPFDSNAWSMGKFVPAKEMMAKIRGVWPTIEAVGDDAHETARLFRVPGYAGKFGIISSMTEQFCATCSRLRITADGQLKVCLFDNSEVCLRTAMRKGVSNLELEGIVGAAVRQKQAALGGHADMHDLARSKNRPMIFIGG